MEQELIDNGNYVSGINVRYHGSLSKSTSCRRVDDKYFEIHKGFVPTFISVCPKCSTDNEWSTTGLLPTYHTCKKCKETFNDQL